jgi:hypothetical protein
MPESCKDRPTDAYEHILMLTKSARYFWDADAVRESGAYAAGEQRHGGDHKSLNSGSRTTAGLHDKTWTGNGTRNLRNVWIFPTQPYKGAHFATFPEELARRCILAATSERGACAACGAPWERIVERQPSTMYVRVRDAKRGVDGADEGYKASEKEVAEYGKEEAGTSRAVGWKAGCQCGTEEMRPCLVLDPFAGSGTTGRVAIELNRRSVLLDLAYHGHAEKRTRNVQKVLSLGGGGG